MRTRILEKLFPTPNFLKMPSVGLDLSGESVKFAELLLRRGQLRLGRFGGAVLPRGCIDGGDVKDQDTLINTLTEVRKKYNLHHIVASLPEEKAYIFNITIPYVPPKEIRESIELQLEGNIPVAPDSVLFDYEVTKWNELTDELEVNISALPVKVIEDYTHVFRESGLHPLVFETDAQAILRAILRKNEEGTFMIVYMGRSRTSFYMYHNGVVLFSSTIDFGGNMITKTIMKEKGLTYNDAEKFKAEKNFLEGTKNGELFGLVVSTLSVLRDEIQKYLTYWNEHAVKEKAFQKENAKVERIIFTGGNAALIGITEFFSTYLNVPFELANPWTNIFPPNSDIPPIHHNDSLKYSVAIGLALFNHLEQR